MYSSNPLLKDLKVDIACISETWLGGYDAPVITEICELDYCTYHVCESRCGGVGILYSPELELKRHENKTEFITIEFIETIL